MSVTDQAGGSAEFCAELVRTHDFARYAATLFVPAAQRRGLLALYAFNVEISRVRDQVSQPLPGEIRLQWWSDMLAGAGHGGVEGNPVAAELLLAIRNWDLPVERLSRLIDEHQFDLYNDPMPTMAALEGYLNETSSALFALAAQMAGWQSGEIEHLARHAGLAQGIAQVIAALPLDAARRQLFVPLQLLESHGSAIEELFAGQANPEAARGAGSADRRSRRPSRRPRARCSRLRRRRSGRHSCRWRWSVAISCGCRAPTAIRSSPVPASRLATLWTLWRARGRGCSEPD